MQEFLPFIVIGLTAGSVYGLAGTGLVLTYKTSGVFNFAYGAIAAVAAVRLLLAPRAAGHGVAARRGRCACSCSDRRWASCSSSSPGCCRRSARSTRSSGMIGLTLGIEALLRLWGNSWSDPGQFVLFPDFLPTETFTVFDVNVGYNQLITMVIALVVGDRAVPLLPVVASRCRMRAVVDDPDLVNIAGTNPTRVRRWAWVIGTMFAAMSGLLLGPTIGVSAIAAHPARRAGVRRRRGRLLLEPAPHLRRRAAHRHRRRAVDEVRQRHHVARRAADQHPVHRAVRRAARDPAPTARTAAITPTAATALGLHRAGPSQRRRRGASSSASSCSSRHRRPEARGLDRSP